ncbi:YtxH domain-containing protein [Paenibacillus caui]|uniref:YtxH domain-containing protein n=1 Tax=Paenibacillus caui TaxID=2873927 RepID=UPI001CA9EC8E|nr:YtxH domain-containing protein [Paenibacillus caui]
MGKPSKSFLWGTVIGAVAGSVTALLFAPKPGKELRKDIAEGARTAAEKTHVAAEKLGEHSAELYSRFKDATEGLIRDVQSRFVKETEADKEEAVVSSEDTEDDIVDEKEAAAEIVAK